MLSGLVAFLVFVLTNAFITSITLILQKVCLASEVSSLVLQKRLATILGEISSPVFLGIVGLSRGNHEDDFLNPKMGPNELIPCFLPSPLRVFLFLAPM